MHYFFFKSSSLLTGVDQKNLEWSTMDANLVIHLIYNCADDIHYFKNVDLKQLMTNLFILTDDLSKQKHATQSTTFPGTYDLYKAGNAVDRNLATCMRTSNIGPTSPDKTVWWMVDLGGVFTIYSVNILFKNYDGFGKLL